ncbi:MAG TPA: macro domain-containing protein [Gemmatimonadales bacterium]|nr:macro domain-containing protein [Gemmatimonadales bacterium]
MIQVVVDDLAFVTADAVVRPADEVLNPVSPETIRLDRQAGERFAALRRVTTPLDAGAAVVTGGGDLAAPFVLHLVIRDSSHRTDRDIVRRALISAWQRAADWGLDSIAAPLIGAGAGQLTLEDAARLMVETFEAHRGGAELRIVLEREDDRALVEAIVQRRPG